MIDSRKPPRQSIRTLIRKAYAARYGMATQITRDGWVNVRGWDGMKAHVDDYSTTRRDGAGCVQLRLRDSVIFTFGPGA